jgi:hypothetical protein
MIPHGPLTRERIREIVNRNRQRARHDRERRELEARRVTRGRRRD